MSKIYETKIYTLKTLTNLHVGNGEVNYSVIDKQVQKDILAGYPTIYSSGLKGALREYMIHQKFKKDEGKDSTRVLTNIIFGSEPVEKSPGTATSNSKAKQGYVNFFDTKLLALPVRCDKVPYLLATSKRVLRAYMDYCTALGLETAPGLEDVNISDVGEGYRLEDHTDKEEITVEEEGWTYGQSTCSANKKLQAFLGRNIVVLKDEHFDTLAKELPFVARNYLENGISKNLWYEEIVPRESLFYFALQKPKDDLLAYRLSNDNNDLSKEAQKQSKKDVLVKKMFKAFDEKLEGAKFFIGANTSVGYGLCEIKELKNE